MMSDEQQNNSKQHEIQQIISHVSYQGLIPHPDILAGFKDIDPTLPERVIRMAEQSLDRLDERLKADIANEKEELSQSKRFIEKEANYDLRAQAIITMLALSSIAAAIYLSIAGYEYTASILVVCGFATIITSAIKGVSNKNKR